MHTDIARMVNEWKPVTITMANGSERLITHQIIGRFVEKVEVSVDGCWRWTAGLIPTGYGSFKVKGIGISAHRFAYLALVGPIPTGLHLDHQCHTEAIQHNACSGGSSCVHRRCVNPSHLKAMTPRDNVLASLSWAAERSKRTTCVNGHALEGDDLYLRRTGGRACYQCHRDVDKRQRREMAVQEGREVLPLPEDRTHCPKGHPYDEANTRFDKRGWRVCHACRVETYRAYRERKKVNRDA